ncbi:Terpene_synth domain-containing protein/Terpene_synth_C domain-containing protein [Cephalotus follicularis]|uniref:Terpene_synth domain-containing protein/Terpene_synth_C domain-containing protein n=1 Tax=Cephalotus follicularis TaxID=3775 RepID=A0A1Q3DEL6_CEPFO|nr:Terpene_synth domain-containing protein/Terpene_synth_C domain-containing protein [Cephalotus follicularis]
MGLEAALLVSPFLVPAARLSSLQSPKNGCRPSSSSSKSARCLAIVHDPPSSVTRRSANYSPSVWDYEFVQSFSSDYTDEKQVRQLEVLKNEVKGLINREITDPLDKLELIDAVQRLGLNYHFEMEIKKALETVNSKTDDDYWLNHGLYSTALRFRILRQHGYNTPQGLFDRFKDKNDNFNASLCEDVKGLLSLYEASFFGLQGETIMDEAKAFTTTHLKDLKVPITASLDRKVAHSLDMPLHWRLNRVEARWFIDTYEQELNMNPTLLELAKLDYNIVQSTHRKEVSNLARWWVNMGLNKMTFVRDRLTEHFIWSSGMVFEPQFGAFREMGTKIICLVTTIDDLYDVYGFLEELELFTDFVDRWDITGIDQLPSAIKTCLLAMYNTSNEIGYWTIKERGFNVIPYLRKMWADICKTLLREAKWYHKGHKPTLEEYLNNAVVSIGAPLVLFCTYFLTAQKITKEALVYVDKLPSIVRCSSMILRLTNDLKTSSDELARGDNLKSTQCYMNETGASEEVAREHIMNMIDETWKTMNKQMFDHYSFIEEPFLSANPNLSRTAHSFYQYGDGHGNPNYSTKDTITALLVQPVPINQGPSNR